MAVSESNEQHFKRYAQKLADECEDNIVEETLSYKPGIDLFDFSSNYVLLYILLTKAIA